MPDLLDLMRARHSARMPYDPQRKPSDAQLRAIAEAASWAPTAHNMQNFELLVIDDPARLAIIGAVKTKTNAVFLAENFAQLSFSKDELLQKKTGLLASMFPPAWRTPGSDFEKLAAASAPAPLSASMQDCPCLLLTLYDSGRRAPASEGDVLGFMSLGCVMENMWLAAQSLGLGLQILSVFSSEPVEREMRHLIGFPDRLKIAFAARLGYPASVRDDLRVRRAVGDFVHRNAYGSKGLA